MNKYKVRKIDLTNVRSFDDYMDVTRNATIRYCNGMRELKEYCGVRLYHQINNIYTGTSRDYNIEYIVEKVK